MLNSLRTRLWLTHVLVVGVALGIVALALLLYLLRNPLLYRQTVLELRLAGNIIARRAPQMANESLEQWTQALRRMDENLGVRLILLAEDGSVLVDSRSGSSGELPPMLPIKEPKLHLPAFRDLEGVTWLYTLQPLSGRIMLMVAKERPKVPVLAILTDNLLPPLVNAGLVALVLGLLLSLAVSRWVAAPLQRIAEAAEGVAAGEYRRLNPSGPEEVQTLARAFNQMMAQVNASRQAQRDFVANVSHELKTPLTSIQGFAQAIMDGTAESEQARRESARVILEEANRMHRLVMDLLDLARFDARTAQMQRVPVEMPALIQGVQSQLAPLAQEAQVAFRVEVSSLPTLVGDPDRLAQVFTNLVENAIKHTPAGGEVRLTAGLEENHICVQVQDTGEGIPHEEQKRIFERFYQLDKSRRGGGRRGVGLGLAIAQEIVWAHGGKVSVESQPGQGSTFIVKLPLGLPDDSTLVKRRAEG